MEFERGLKFARKGSDTELGLRYYLAECYEKTRDLHSAIYQWEKIVEVKPNFRDVQAKLKNYAEFRQDDRIKDFLISGLSQFEHTCRKIVEAMNFTITDINIISDTEIEIIATESEGKWRNTRPDEPAHPHLPRHRNHTGEDLRTLHESMKAKNATRIIVISTGDFSQSAVDFANTRPIELYGKNELDQHAEKILSEPAPWTSPAPSSPRIPLFRHCLEDEMRQLRAIGKMADGEEGPPVRPEEGQFLQCRRQRDLRDRVDREHRRRVSCAGLFLRHDTLHREPPEREGSAPWWTRPS